MNTWVCIIKRIQTLRKEERERESDLLAGVYRSIEWETTKNRIFFVLENINIRSRRIECKFVIILEQCMDYNLYRHLNLPRKSRTKFYIFSRVHISPSSFPLFFYCFLILVRWSVICMQIACIVLFVCEIVVAFLIYHAFSLARRKPRISWHYDFQLFDLLCCCGFSSVFLSRNLSCVSFGYGCVKLFCIAWQLQSDSLYTIFNHSNKCLFVDKKNTVPTGYPAHCHK